MKALRLHGIGDVRIHDEPKPQPQPGEVLLQVTAVGICGSDIHWYAEGTTGAASMGDPFVLGHEFAAVVESGALSGARVAVEPHVACGHCRFCAEGNPNLCPDHYFAGQAPQDGALRQYICWPEEYVFPIPDNISDEAGAPFRTDGCCFVYGRIGATSTWSAGRCLRLRSDWADGRAACSIVGCAGRYCYR
jgi:L-iditol 2-dehydrogenase